MTTTAGQNHVSFEIEENPDVLVEPPQPTGAAEGDDGSPFYTLPIDGKIVNSVDNITHKVYSSSQLHCCEFHLGDPFPAQNEDDKYVHSHPLVHSLLKEEPRRRKRFNMEGSKQINHPPSNHSWLRTLAIWEGRAMDYVLMPWSVAVGHATLYTCLQEFVLKDDETWENISKKELGSWETFFGIALNATLSLLLVFRLNRAATRWWLSRQFFGVLMAKARNLTCGLVLAKHNPTARDDAIRWLAAFAVFTMEFLRGCHKLNDDLFAGVLSPREKSMAEQTSHPPLYAAHQIRHHISCIYAVSAETPMSLAVSYNQQEANLIKEWTVLLDQVIRMRTFQLLQSLHVRHFSHTFFTFH